MIYSDPCQNESEAFGEGKIMKEVFKRVEKKYLLSKFQYYALRKLLEDYAEVDQYGKTQILNIYYDTDDFRLIRTSIDKPVYKEKLRLRSYGVPTDRSNAFVELKKKFQGVVYKRRIPMSYADAEQYLNSGVAGCQDWTDEERQIFGEIDFFRQRNGGLSPKMVVAYDRIALVGKQDPELRITFDENIRWRIGDLDLRCGGEGEQLLEDGQYLMEIKITGAMPLVIAQMLSRLRIYPISYSKYGAAYLRLLQQQTERMADRIIADDRLEKSRARRAQRRTVTGRTALWFLQGSPALT